MNISNIKSPGVYLNDLNAFPNSIVPVATAIPAFVGYTPQAVYEGKSYLNVPQKISSFSEFCAIYCYPDAAAPAPMAKQYSPQYYLVAQEEQPAGNEYIVADGVYYIIVPDASTIYYLYNSIKLFYQNGGGDAYIVSVGTYGAPSAKPMTAGAELINAHVRLNDLLAGLALLQKEQEPTMYICPEATLLSVADNSTLMQTMLQQCASVQRAISIFDIIGGRNPDPITYMTDIQTFREGTGVSSLNYGAAYYPFVGTTIMQSGDIDYTNFFGGDMRQLAPIVNGANNPSAAIAAVIANIESGSSSIVQNNNALINASEVYATIIKHVLVIANVLPASGAMAGVITTTDNAEGVWEAPANRSIVGAVLLPIILSETQQGALTTDDVSGKFINAIRFFNGLGILIWGARTLDGNSADWRYLSVRRTMIFIEQSCQMGIRAYVFQPNNKNTWAAVTSMIISFLTSVWKEGGLMGASPSEAFSVDCGFGTTMTGDDILNGFMNITIKVALVHPAEFIVITLQQEMPTTS